MIGFTAKNLSPPNAYAGLLLAGVLYGGVLGICQVFTVEREHVAPNISSLTTFQPTSIRLEDRPLTPRTRQSLIRLFQAEQAFAVRPLPLGKRGLTLRANGPLSPSGKGYVDDLEKYGISCKPGDRVVISKFVIRPDRILFEFNGGPEEHHRILQHVEVGGMAGMAPLAPDDGEEPIGSRVTLVFQRFVPEMSAAQLRDLIAPILDFSLKTPVQAFADALPPKLKTAVLNHRVLVGMNREMVLRAVGQPDRKVREVDGQAPFEEWIYGQPPHEVQFVRFNGDRVIRLEVAQVGQKLVIRDQDETNGYLAGPIVRRVHLGDAPPADANREHGPAPAPTLRSPGEKLPDAVDQDHQLKPVQFPGDNPEPTPIPPPPSQGPPMSGLGSIQLSPVRNSITST